MDRESKDRRHQRPEVRTGTRQSDYIFKEEHVPKLAEALAEVAYKWEEIAVALRLPRHVIEECRVKGSELSMKLYHVLYTWVVGQHSNAALATRENLKTALAGPLVQHAKLASELEDKLKTSLMVTSIPASEFVKTTSAANVQDKLTVQNMKIILKRMEFAASDADKLGEQLDEVSPAEIKTIKKNHGSNDWDSILTDILQHWLNNDTERSWQKLAIALHNCGYKVAANYILGKDKHEEIESSDHILESIPQVMPEQMEERIQPFSRKRKEMPGQVPEMPKHDSVEVLGSKNKTEISMGWVILLIAGVFIILLLLYPMVVQVFLK